MRPVNATRTKANISKQKHNDKVGKLGGIFGFTVTAVLRRSGREGLSTAHVAAIMQAKRIKLGSSTPSIQVCAGRNRDKDRGEPAALTAGQLAELVHAAPDPVKAEKARAKK